ncbi:Rieske (2Fe-2S) iron-sulfur domain protein [Sphingobium chlorophenolicum L-1]|uniref:Rieske (2Fe-2S) iron-sulfur domain protein n=1 Tax=Sphingobium chlorophenolicum L-1 TaxID=690566 RepID=F6F1N4_SPHCR|nr:aromatic ring-hydroxylating dioxygenase subunit alpha [Sphingobium chlorophenolicum]AEG51450.1 Rieske (2Fe-2S) iron-sulfur domain protein [Sphingobium chlorophenolicum L-1]
MTDLSNSIDLPGDWRSPLEPYRSPEWFDAERDRIFGRAWLLAGRVEEVPEPGSFTVKEFEVRDASVIVMRGKDGVVRAFHNVCPHRGNQVVWEEQGRQPALVCRYHNWTFSAEGRLRGVPDQGAFPGLDTEKCGLAPIHLEIWEGWLFINLSPAPEIGLDEFLGGMKDYLGGIDYIHADAPIVIRTRLKCNWKIVADAFAEAYHIPAIHNVSLKPRFADVDNPFGRPLLFRAVGPHGVNSMYGRPDYAPQEDQIVERLAFDPQHRSGEQADKIAAFGKHPAVNPTGARGWSMDVNYIFPNTHLDANPLGFFTHQFWPVGPTETQHEARFYVGKPLTVRERFAIEHRVAHAVDVILEDLSNVERTQKGINSRGTDFMQLSESEALIMHAAQQIARWVEAPTVRAALDAE